MSPERRTLTDELHSVLLSHSLNAPAPGPTIEQILARAASSDTGPAAEAKTSEKVGAGQGQGGLRRPGARQPWHPRTIAVWVGAVAAVGLVAVGGVGVLGIGGGSESKSSSAASSQSGFAAAPAAGSASSSAGATVPSARSGLPSGPTSGPFSAITDRVTCPGPARPARAALVYRGQNYDAVGVYCYAGASSPAGSLVEIWNHGGSQSQLLGTLISPTQQLQVEGISGLGDKVVVRALSLLAAPAGVPAAGGDVRDYAFAGSAPFAASGSRLVAAACTASQLKVSVSPSPSTASESAALIAVENQSTTPCAVSGYLDVLAARAGGRPIAASHSLAGPRGGVRGSVLAPVLVLPHGDSSTALVESAAPVTSDAPPCARVATLTVSLATPGRPVQQLAALDYPIGLCGLQVHPLVAGISGSSG